MCFAVRCGTVFRIAHLMGKRKSIASQNSSKAKKLSLSKTPPHSPNPSEPLFESPPSSPILTESLLESPHCSSTMSFNFGALQTNPDFIQFIRSVVDQTLKQHTNSHTACQNCERLTIQVESLHRVVDELKQTLSHSSSPTGQNCNQISYWESPKINKCDKTATALFLDSHPQYHSTHIISSCLQNTKAFIDKEKVLVLEQIPDDAKYDRDTPNPADTEIALKLCGAAGLKDKFVKCWRCPSATNPRPLKIELTDGISRDLVLKNAGKALKLSNVRATKGRRVYARRDMTRPELNIHRSMRSWVYNTNKSLGMSQYYYYDLNVYTNKEPKRFTAN